MYLATAAGRPNDFKYLCGILHNGRRDLGAGVQPRYFDVDGQRGGIHRCIHAEPVSRAGLGQASELMSNTSTIQITAGRDSVCAGDDVVSHEASFSVASSCDVLALLRAAWQACPLAGVAGGQATWLIDVPDANNCIGVAAQQWHQPKLLISPDTPVEELFRGKERSLYFRYWCQSDPDIVFHALQSKAALPDRYSS